MMLAERNHSHKDQARQSTWRLGVVSYLNSMPLVASLGRDSTFRLDFDVPARLSDRLLAGEFDAALVPVVDILRSDAQLQIASSACIACDGETLTVRVFSNCPPRDVRVIHLDPESHTSAALVRILWPQLHGKEVQFKNLRQATTVAADEAVLLIGDKVVGPDAGTYRYQVDLGGAWKTWTGLPFVFAVWTMTTGFEQMASLGARLDAARDIGCRQAAQLAVEHGPRHGWSVPLAQLYLQRYLSFELTPVHVEGMVHFLDLVRAHGLAPLGSTISAQP